MMTRQIALLRPDQISAEIAKYPVAYLPLGLLEWHGPHLPTGTDALNAEKVALLAAEKAGGLVMPTVYWGTERERSPQLLDWLGFDRDTWIVGMDFPANSLPSMYASEESFAYLIREQLRLIIRMGFKLAVIISGHAAENQMAVLERLAKEFTAESSARILVALPFVPDQNGLMAVGHASRIETSVMMALYPESVDLSKLPPEAERLRNVDWAIVDYFTFSGNPSPDRTVSDLDDPRHASAEEGWNNVNRAASQIAQLVQKALRHIS